MPIGRWGGTREARFQWRGALGLDPDPELKDQARGQARQGIWSRRPTPPRHDERQRPRDCRVRRSRRRARQGQSLPARRRPPRRRLSPAGQPRCLRRHRRTVRVDTDTTPTRRWRRTTMRLAPERIRPVRGGRSGRPGKSGAAGGSRSRRRRRDASAGADPADQAAAGGGGDWRRLGRCGGRLEGAGPLVAR